MAETASCTISGCAKPAAASLERHPPCVDHFTSTCYQRIDGYADRLRQRSSRLQITDEISSFVDTYTQEVLTLVYGTLNLDRLQQARLLDLVLSAGELSQHIRRSPRIEVAVPVRLHCQTTGRQMEEETKTRTISRYGALVECQRHFQPKDKLLVERLDRPMQAKARVVSICQTSEGFHAVAIEFLNCDNFWELDWSRPEPTAR